MKHDWYITGVIIKPYIKDYHNNLVLTCNHCSKYLVVVSHKRYDVIEFKNQTELAEYLVDIHWKIKVWPSLKKE